MLRCECSRASGRASSGDAAHDAQRAVSTDDGVNIFDSEEEEEDSAGEDGTDGADGPSDEEDDATEDTDEDTDDATEDSTGRGDTTGEKYERHREEDHGLALMIATETFSPQKNGRSHRRSSSSKKTNTRTLRSGFRSFAETLAETIKDRSLVTEFYQSVFHHHSLAAQKSSKTADCPCAAAQQFDCYSLHKRASVLFASAVEGLSQLTLREAAAKV